MFEIFWHVLQSFLTSSMQVRTCIFPPLFSFHTPAFQVKLHPVRDGTNGRAAFAVTCRCGLLPYCSKIVVKKD